MFKKNSCLCFVLLNLLPQFLFVAVDLRPFRLVSLLTRAQFYPCPALFQLYYHCIHFLYVPDPTKPVYTSVRQRTASMPECLRVLCHLVRGSALGNMCSLLGDSDFSSILSLFPWSFPAFASVDLTYSSSALLVVLFLAALGVCFSVVRCNSVWISWLGQFSFLRAGLRGVFWLSPFLLLLGKPLVHSWAVAQKELLASSSFLPTIIFTLVESICAWTRPYIIRLTYSQFLWASKASPFFMLSLNTHLLCAEVFWVFCVFVFCDIPASFFFRALHTVQTFCLLLLR